MPNNKITFDTVRRIALALPHVEEGTIYGSPPAQRPVAMHTSHGSASRSSATVMPRVVQGAQ